MTKTTKATLKTKRPARATNRRALEAAARVAKTASIKTGRPISPLVEKLLEDRDPSDTVMNVATQR